MLFPNNKDNFDYFVCLFACFWYFFFWSLRWVLFGLFFVDNQASDLLILGSIRQEYQKSRAFPTHIPWPPLPFTPLSLRHFIAWGICNLYWRKLNMCVIIPSFWSIIAPEANQWKLYVCSFMFSHTYMNICHKQLHPHANWNKQTHKSLSLLTS